HKNLVIQIGNFEKTLCGTTAQLDNIGSYNCSFINYGTETTSYAAISGMKRGGTITADHIYAFDTKRSSAAESQVADTAMENLFYAFSTACKLNLNDCLTNASTTYKLAYDNTNASDATDIALPEEFIAQDTSLPALITQMNQTKGKNHLEWKLDETGLPVTTYFDNALFTPGDVNNDGTVDVLDALVVLRLLSGETYTGELNERAMFVNDDKIVDTSDATLILQKAAGKEVTLLAASADETIVINEEGNYCFESSLAFDTATIKVLSQNILHSGSFTHPNGLNGSTYRRARIKTLIETYKADLIGLQEYRHDGWFTFFEDELLPADSYGNYIVSRADPNRDTAEEAKELFTQYAGNEAAQRANALTPDERLAIFWKKDAFELVDDTKGIFWFSDTPDVHSPSFGTVSNEELELHSSGNYYVDNRARITIWVKLRVIGTNLEFYYFNFHFPNASGTAARTTQVKSVQLLTSQVEKICAEYGNAPVILGGDMNTDYFYEADWPALYEMEKNFSDVALQYMEEQGETDQPDGTFPSFGSNVSEDGSVDSRIDYFFVRNNDGTGIQHFEVLNKTFKADGTMQDTYGTYNADWENTDYGASEIVDPETEGENEGNNEDNKDTTKAYYLKFNDTYYVSDHFGLYGEFVISNKLSAVSDLTLNTPSTATVETENDLPITLALTGLDDDNTCSPGDELTATIALKEGANLSSLPLTLTYDPMVLELVTDTETDLMTCDQKETSGGTVTAAFYSEDNITAGGTLLTAKFKAINTDAVKDSKVTASIAPIFDSAYYAARYDSNGIPYALDYSSESISSTFNSYAAIAQNTTTGANYFDLTTALNEAAENETVVLLQDTEVSEIVVNTGSTFDLNGHVLKTDTVLSYGDIVDGAENGVGGVQIPANTEENENMILQPTNAQLPLYDQANGCYRFFACSVESAGYKNGTNTSVKFGYYLKFEKAEAYTLLKNDPDATGMTFSVHVTWDGLDKTVQYKFSSGTIRSMATYWLNGSKGVALTLTVTGLNIIAGKTLETTPA
ncbi:MAG: endonuclease/exonuclease/phosphatase family protein, partial [Clostridia bacterium]|nr:endonuclease/exonuclease/phosphatase family protein [Clostridia bacterium]